jgi:L-alanine-DL-glutamate epimerase-like enolase superfamily enzyme
LPTKVSGQFRILDAQYFFQEHELSPPLVIGKGIISTITEAMCRVTITDGTKTAHGFGTVLLSHVWCGPETEDVDKDATLRAASLTIADAIATGQTEDSLLGHGFRLLSLSDQLLGHIPPLARRVCSAPLDNAIHDAAGCLYNCSSFELFAEHGSSPFDKAFPGFGAATAIESMLRRPVATIDAQMVVGITTQPEAILTYCSKYNIRRLKVKIGSGDVQTDVDHVIAVSKAVPISGDALDITVDANGCYVSPESLSMFLSMIREAAPEVAVCISAIEQPAMSPQTEDRLRWLDIAEDTPILVDEAFTEMDDLKHANACGWNGLAVKSCRGQTLALLGAAWGHARGWRNKVMDLTSPNIAALHTVLLAAHITGVSTAEVNAAQFLRSGYEALPEELVMSIVPTNGRLTVPDVTEGLVPHEYRQVLMKRFEELDV